VIYVRPAGSGDERHWRLAQLPKAQSALISLDPSSGAIVALQGGYSFSTSNFNRAVQSERQAGSVFKPFIYTSAMENGFTPASIINDAPVV
ncbi:penicillin-binding transpeptidase domain-containing protein, partial [Alcanivorax sp. HI0083]